MYPIANKLYFASNYIEIPHNDIYIFVNEDTNSNCLVNREQYQIFQNLLVNKNNPETLSSLIDENQTVYNFVIMMIEKGLLAMKPFIKSSAYEVNPVSAYWGITDECNFHCKYCYANCEAVSTGKTYHEKLTLEECKIIVDKVKDYGFFELVITGGEPLLEKKVFQVAEYAKQAGLMCGLLTNGSLVNRYDIDNFKVFDYVKISLDSMDENTNDSLRGKGSFKKIIQAIKALVSNNITVDVGSVITKLNKKQLKELMTVLHNDYNIRNHSLVNHIPIGRGSNSELSCTFEEIEECDKYIMESKFELHKDRLFSVIQDMFIIEGRKLCCGMGISEIYINEIGNIYPCRMNYDESSCLGNMIDGDLKEILKNNKILNENISVDVLEGCKDCQYRYICGGGCRMFHNSYSGSIYINSPDVCELYIRQLKDLFLIKNGVNPLCKQF